MLETLTLWLTSNIAAWGYLAVVVLMGLESANIPIPSEVVLPFAGFLVAQGRMEFHLAALAGALGCLWGSVVSYWLGRRFGRPFVERYGRWFLIGPTHLAHGDRLFARFGNATSFLARLLPVVRTFISLIAGIWRVSFVPFAILSFVGSWMWSYLLVYLGLQLGDHWTSLRPLWHKFDVVIMVLAGAGFLAYLWHHWKESRRS